MQLSGATPKYRCNRFYGTRVAAVLTACSSLVALLGCASRDHSTPVMIDRKSSLWNSSDGRQSSYRVWPGSNNPPRFEVIAVHGLGGRDTDFSPLAPLVQSLGGRIVAINLRGMGTEPSPRERGHIEDGYRWVTDLDEFVQEWTREDEDLPRYLVAESLGAVIALHWMHSKAHEKIPGGLNGAFLLSPVVAIDGEFKSWQRFLYWLFRTFAPRHRIRPADFADASQPPPRVTRDPDYEAYLAAAPHRLDELSIGLLWQMQRLIADLQKIDKLPAVPVLLAYAGEDIFVNAADIRDFFASRRDGEQIKEVFYPEAYHLLLYDPETPNLLLTVKDWIELTMAGDEP